MIENYTLECGRLVIDAELHRSGTTEKAILRAATPNVLDSRSDLEAFVRQLPGGNIAWFFLGRVIPASLDQLPWDHTYLGIVNITMDPVLTQIVVTMSRQSFEKHLLPMRKLG